MCRGMTINDTFYDYYNVHRVTVAAASESRCSRRRDVYNTTVVELNDYTLTYYNVSKSRPSGKNHVRYRFSGYYDLRSGRRSVQHPAGRCAI